MSGIGYVANTVEHGAADAGKDGDEGQQSPALSVHDPWADNGPDDAPEGHNCKESNDACHPGEPVSRSVDLWVRSARQVARKPVADGLGCWSTIACVSSCKYPYCANSGDTNPETKSNRRGSTLETAYSPVEGWKRSRTGAVCRPSYGGYGQKL